MILKSFLNFWQILRCFCSTLFIFPQKNTKNLTLEFDLADFFAIILFIEFVRTKNVILLQFCLKPGIFFRNATDL